MRPVHKTALLISTLLSITSAGSINSIDYDREDSKDSEEVHTVNSPSEKDDERQDRSDDRQKQEYERTSNSSSSTTVTTTPSYNEPSGESKSSTYALKVYMGYRTHLANATDYKFTVVDDSDSKDHLTTSGQFDGTGAFAFGVGLETNTSEQVHREYVGEFQFGSYKLYSFQIGLGVNANLSDKLTIRPKGNIGYARTILDLGDLENNETFIQFGEKLYWAESMEVEAKHHNFIATPSVDFVFDVDDDWYATFNVGYQFVWNLGTPYVEFSSDDDDEGSTKMDVDDNHLSFLIDNDVVDELPFSPNGFSVGFAISFNI